LPIAIACAALSGCALTKQISPDTYQSTRSAESRKLHEIFESFFEAELVLFPTFATESATIAMTTSSKLPSAKSILPSNAACFSARSVVPAKSN